MCGGCCFGNNPDEACGYPPKTIRAFISVTICLISFLIFAFLAISFTINEQYAHAMAMVGLISTELGTVIGYYFGSSTNKKESQVGEKLEDGRLKEEKLEDGRLKEEKKLEEVKKLEEAEKLEVVEKMKEGEKMKGIENKEDEDLITSNSEIDI
jgi:hypothetical protein